MPQFMVKENLQINQTTKIVDDDAHHVIDVLRLKVNDWIQLSDGKGNRFKGIIQQIDKKHVNVLIKQALKRILPSNITLAQAVIKHDKIEDIIKKSVELGITKIAPFLSSRTIPKYSGNSTIKKVDRWQKIAQEAAKQCGQSFTPEIKNISTLKEILNNSSTYTHKLIFFEGENKASISSYFQQNPFHNENTIIVIGPEGGFSKEEIDLGQKNGFTTLSLGPLILRVDTAAISAITLTQYHVGYFTSS